MQGFSRFCAAAFPVVAEVAGFASNGPSTAEDAIFLIDSGDTYPYIPGVVIAICSAFHLIYPAGDGSIAIFASMPANSCRVR